MNKRMTPVPSSIPYRYVGKDRINNFQMGQNTMRRLVSESFRAGTRNHKVPTTSSPIMMTSGVAPSDKIVENDRTVANLVHFRSKADYILQKQGPSVLPLSGSGGSPIRMAHSQQF